MGCVVMYSSHIGFELDQSVNENVDRLAAYHQCSCPKLDLELMIAVSTWSPYSLLMCYHVGSLYS